ncbi:DUF2974 family protein [Kineothrix alysoides]|uniref:DUF2974 family protein n=1 Tax=Kineothrix alysoides TaxID=1469948 RepID=A0A4R1QQ89_9FIRM|nr:Mbeg1-like protein [Kineothrix alysoides]TCL55918.1 DUF2974 family protein [Kineothrix alysoides]
MGTIIDYLKEYGDYTFAKRPMNEVDSLVLCQFSYLKFDGIVPDVLEDKPFVTIEYLNRHQEKEKLFADERYKEENTALFAGMLGSARYGSLKMNYYVNLIEPERETQFSAVTYLLEDKTVYLAYRGTDETIVGWKEDFNLAFSEPVPGQRYSVEYMKTVARKFSKEFYVGGHSKGGNFAVFASMNCGPEIQKRIVKIFSHDGPGFRPEIRERGQYEKIADRVVRILPHSSIVGMLFGAHEDGYIVVESKTFGLLQHDPYTWLIKDDAFVKAKDIYKSRRFMDDALNDWILSLDEEHIHSFVDTLYDVVSASEAATLIDFTADWKKSMLAVVGAVKGLDAETAGMMKKIIVSLFEVAGAKAKEELQERSEKRRRRKEIQAPAVSHKDKK